MRPLIPLIVLALIIPAGEGRAEFRVTSTPDASTSEPIPSRLSPATTRQTTSHTPRSILRGFGTDIPLSFAIRQIVPPDVEVAYGPNVDPEQLTVTWRGGRPWLTTLRAAVAPSASTSWISPIESPSPFELSITPFAEDPLTLALGLSIRGRGCHLSMRAPPSHGSD
jgi:hypothetical protein